MAVGTKIGDLFFDVSADVTKAALGIPKAGAALGASMTKSIGSAISRSVGAVTAPLVAGFETAAAAGVAVFGAVLTTGFGRLRAIDDATGKLKALGHDTTEVATIMDSALQSVLGTQYNLGEAATAAAAAVAAGIKPGKELTDYLTLIADTATVAGVSMESAGAIINKTTAFQRVYLREINQLAQKGIPIFTWLQKEYGVTGAELRKMVSDGEVDAATFQRVIQENIGGAAVEFGKSTFSGGLKNVFAAMGRLGETLLGPFFDSLRDSVFPAAIELFDGLNEIAKPWMENFAKSEGFTDFIETLASLPAKIGPAIDKVAELGPALGPLTGLIGAKGLGQLKNLLGPFGAFLPKLSGFAGILLGMVASSSELRSAFGDLFQALLDLASALTPLIDPFSQLLDIFAGNLLAPAVRGLADGVGWLADQLGVLGPVMDTVSSAVREFVEGFKGGFGENAKKDLGGVASAAGNLGERFQGVIDWIVSQWPAAQTIAVGVFAAVKDAMTTAINFIIDVWPTAQAIAVKTFDAIRGAVETAIAYIIDAWPTVQRAIKRGIDGIKVAIDWAVDTGIPALVTAFQAVVEFVKAHWPTVQAVVVGVMDALVTAFQAVQTWVQTNWPAIQNAIMTVVNALVTAFQWFTTNILPQLVAGFQAVWAYVQEVWPDVQAIIVGVLQAVGIIIAAAAIAISYIWDNFGDDIVNTVTTVWGLVSGLIEGSLQVIRGILDVFVGVFTGDWQRAWDGVKGIVEGAWNIIKTIVEFAINQVKDIVELAMSLLSEAWERAWAAIKLAAELAIAPIVFAVVTLRDWLQIVWDKAKEVAGYFEVAFGVALGLAIAPIAALYGAIEKVFNWLQDVWDKAVEVAGYIGGAVFGAALDTAAAAWNVVTDAVGAVVDVLKTVIDWAGKALSPLKKVIDAAAAVASIISNDISGKVDPNLDLSPFGVPGKALGGPVFAGHPYIVGEKRPELFVPDRDGTIYPNLDALRPASGSGGDGGGWNVEVNIDARGATDPQAVGAAAQQGTLAALAQYTAAR